MGRPRKKRKISKASSPRARLKKKGARKGAKGTKRRGEPKVVETLPSGPPRKPRSAGSSRKGSKDPDRQRLQKVLAAAGIGSRRECETYIVEGRVDVDGDVVTELGTTVNPTKQKIRFDGDPISRFKAIYYIVNKPTGILSTNKDPAGRMRVIDLVPDGTKLFTVGRLDKGSEGLMLVTNDGDLANRLAHPSFGVEKIYQVVVAGSPKSDDLKTLRRGVHLAEGVVRVSRLSVKKKLKNSTQLEMVLTEGRNREIRRMAASIGHKVISLKRIGLGPLRLGTMPVGTYRPLTSAELKRVKVLVEGKKPSKRRAASARVSIRAADSVEKSRTAGKDSRSAKGARGGKTSRSAGTRGKNAGGKVTKKKTTKAKVTKGRGAAGKGAGGKASSGKGAAGRGRVRTAKSSDTRGKQTKFKKKSKR